MDSVLNKLVGNDTKNKKEQTKQTKLLAEILSVQKDILKVEESRNKKEDRDRQKAKRAGADKSPAAIFKKDKKEKDKNGKGFLDGLLGTIGGILGGLGGAKILAALGIGAIGTAIASYFTSENFRKFMDKNVGVPMGKALEQGMSNLLKDTLLEFKPKTQRTSGRNASTKIDILGTKNLLEGVYTQIANDKNADPKQLKLAEDLLRNISQIDKKQSKVFQLQKQQKFYERDIADSQKYIDETRKEAVENNRSLTTLEENAIKSYQASIKESKEEVRIRKVNIKANEDMIKSLLTVEVNGKKNNEMMLQFINDARARAQKVDPNYDGSPLNMSHFQKGGHVNVPGSGSGDKVPMMLPGGSFVMNRNASMMLQNGGMVPTLLEPGEKVFGPGQWGPMEQMMNSTFGRFQNGGEIGEGGIKFNSAGQMMIYKGGKWVLDKPGGSDSTVKAGSQKADDADKPASKAGQSTLDKLNRSLGAQMISAPPGYCVTGTLDTMQANGVGNPGWTGADKGNNPRGMAAQLINSFGWGAAYGSNLTLDSPYGAASSKELTGSQYNKLIAAGSIPSGALIFQTRHDSWNGTSAGSRGYDAAIAQNNGSNLWNGQDHGANVYGNTKKVMVLTPGGSSSSGAPGIPGSGMGGGIMQSLSPALQAFADFAMAFGGSALSGLGSLMGGGGNNTSVSGGTGPVDMGADTNAKLMNAAKLAMQAGFTKEQAKTMAAIAGGESSFNNRAYNGVGADDSYGLWQINMLGAMGTERLKSLGLSSKSDLYDPATNARAAKQIYDSQGFGAWGAYKDGNANKYMNAAQALKLQNGGVANMSGSGTNSRQMISKSQQQFAEMIASAASPVVVPVPMGGGGGGGNQGGASGASTPFPILPSEDSSIVAMEYKYRITMGASV